MLKVVELRASLINLALLAFSTTSVSVTAADLTIQVTGVSSDDGTVRVALHDGAEGFPRDRQMIAGRFANASTQGVTLIFKDVAQAGMQSRHFTILMVTRRYRPTCWAFRPNHLVSQTMLWDLLVPLTLKMQHSQFKTLITC